MADVLLPLPSDTQQYGKSDGTPTKEFYNWLHDLDRRVRAGPADITQDGLPWFDVTAAPYNAVGDGQANDHDAIQAAYDDAIAAGGALVVFPKAPNRNDWALYYVDEPIIVDGPVQTA